MSSADLGFWEGEAPAEPSPNGASLAGLGSDGASPSRENDRALRRARKRHWEVLGVCLFVVVMALALQVLPDQQHIAFRGFARYPMPHVCTSRTWLGVKCPGCGLTRSIIHLAHADWSASLRCHRLGWMMAAVIAFQFPYRLLSLRRPDRPLFGPRTRTVLGLTIIALLIGSWLYDLAFVPSPPETDSAPFFRSFPF